MIWLVNVIIVSLFILCLKNFRAGYVGCLTFRLLFPWYVFLKIGTFQVNTSYVFMAFFIVAYCVQKEQKLNVYSKFFSKLFGFYLIYTVALVFLSSALAPYGFQFRSIISRIILGDVGWFVFGAYAFRKGDFFCRKFMITLFCVIGIYGIFAYLINLNPWTSYLSLIYGNEEKYSFFLTEIRGNLTGRTSGTFEHPLAWGQFWNVLLCFFIVRKEDFSKWSSYFFV